MVFPFSAGIPFSGLPFSKESVTFGAWGIHQAKLVGCFVKACYNNITDVHTAETDVVVYRKPWGVFRSFCGDDSVRC